MAEFQNLNITDTGFVKFSAGSTGQRPGSPAEGDFRYNTSTGVFEYYINGGWVSANKKYNEIDLIGNSSGNPARSGWHLIQQRPDISNGFYWIHNELMPNPLQMWVDTTFDGGGYDFYAAGGDSDDNFDNSDYRVSHGDSRTGTEESLGLEIIYPRSPNHWRAMYNYVSTQLGEQLNQRFNGHVGKIFRPTSRNAGSQGSGDYVGQIMRSPMYYGSGAQDWQVPDGGRWWLRNSTYTEPNGDYDEGSPLARRNIDNPYNGQDTTFNDGARYTASPNFLYSTNMKP